MTGFRLAGRLDVTALAAAVETTLDRFDDRWRRTMPFSPHQDTDAVFLRASPSMRPIHVLNSLEVVETPVGRMPVFAQAVAQCAQMVGGKPARALVARLKPQGRIKPHTDIGEYAHKTDRYHLPIITNPGAWLEVAGARQHLPAGELWWFDKHQDHCGANEGDAYRYHLIVDIWRAA